MDAVTYSNENVIAGLEKLFIPLRIDASQGNELARTFKVDVTPVAIATDHKQKLFYRWDGFLAPEEFQHMLKLMRAAVEVDHRKYDAAIALLFEIVDKAFGCAATAEALYLLGVAKYKKSGDFQQAVEQWRRLKLSYPNHPLIKKVEYAL